MVYHILYYRVRQINLTLYIFGPTGSRIYRTGQNEIPLEPQSFHEDFGISHAQIGRTLQTVTRAYQGVYFFSRRTFLGILTHFWSAKKQRRLNRVPS